MLPEPKHEDVGIVYSRDFILSMTQTGEPKKKLKTSEKKKDLYLWWIYYHRALTSQKDKSKEKALIFFPHILHVF